MTAIDIDRLLLPVSESSPCGPGDFEYDPGFNAYLDAIKGGIQPSEGARDADWDALCDQGQELFSQGKHLRIAHALAIALVRVHGIDGLASGIALIRRLLNDLWDSVQPVLDADDDNDPTERVNAVKELGTFDGFLRTLWLIPVADSRQIGRVSWREYLIADGRLKPVDDTPPMDKALIAAGLQEITESDLQARIAALQQALDDLQGIDAIFDDKTPGLGPQLDPLRNELKLMHRLFDGALRSRSGQAPQADSATASGVAADAPVRGAARVAVGAIASRDDVVRALDAICGFYRANEPSSPVPILLRRAQRLVNAEFIDIIRDLTPQGMEQIQFFVGASSDS